MKIKRIGASKKHYWTILLEESAISDVRVDDDRNVEIIFNRVKSKQGRNTAHQYSITLTPDDIGKIMGEVYKQALTKNN